MTGSHYFLRLSHYHSASPAFSLDGVIQTLQAAKFDAGHGPHEVTTWMPKRLFVYDSIDRHVDLQMLPMQIRWSEWDYTLTVLKYFFEHFDTVQLLFAVYNYTGGRIASGFIQEL